jgi:hypothetical protein
MNGDASKGRLSTMDLIVQLGFAETKGVLGHRFDFGNCELSAVECVNMRMVPVVAFSGVVCDRRTVGEIAFEMPLHVDSYEQGVAWIAYGLRNARLRTRPEWLGDGERWRSHLPWVKT